MVGRGIVLGLAIALWSGCDCEPKRASQDPATPAGFDDVMKEHAALSLVARNALIRGDLAVAQQAMRKLAFFMEHVPFPEQGKEYARITRELAGQVREAGDLEEACMAFARLSYACGQCHHALDRGPPIKLEPAPGGEDLRMHMRRHYWAVERMWEALLSDSPAAFPATRFTTLHSPPQSRAKRMKTTTFRSRASRLKASPPHEAKRRSSGVSCRPVTSAIPWSTRSRI